MKRTSKVILTALVLAMLPTQALAKKVYSPIVKEGEIELETQNDFIFSKDPAKDGNSKHQIELSYGFTDYWHSGVYVVYEKAPEESTRHTQNKWANIIQLTGDPEAYWLNMGFYIEYIWDVSSVAAADTLEIKALFEKPVEHWKHTLNLVFKKPLSSQSDTSLGYAWRSRYKMDSGLEPAIEIYGSLGTTDQIKLTKQSLLVGPVVEYGFKDGLMDGFEVNMGWLIDANEGINYGDLKLNLEYEF